MTKPRIACTAVIVETGWIVGMAEENIAGYSPMNYGPFETEKEARDLADHINEKLGHDKKTAFLIVTSSMWPVSAEQHAERVKNW